MAEGTAVAEFVTAPEVVATEAEESPEAALLEGTETEDSEASTDSVDAPEEVGEPETLTREEHEKALRAATAKLEESYRQKVENEQKKAQDVANAEAYKANVTRSQQVKAGALTRELMQGIDGVIKSRDQGEDVSVNPQWLANLAAQQADAAFWDQDSAISEFFDAHVAKQSPEWRKPPELSSALERALHLHQSDPNRPAKVLEARLAIMEAAVTERLTPRLREEIEAEVRAEITGAGKTAAMKANDAVRAGQPKPTGLGTTGRGTPPNPRAVLESANSSMAEKRKAYESLYGISSPR
jgi:hypothetical protein